MFVVLRLNKLIWVFGVLGERLVLARFPLANVCLMLAQRRRRQANIKPTLVRFPFINEEKWPVGSRLTIGKSRHLFPQGL